MGEDELREFRPGFVSKTFLRSVWQGAYESYRGTEREARVLKTLTDWSQRADLKETGAESALLSNVFEGVWGYSQSGSGSASYTMRPKLSVPGAGPKGRPGEVDAALGFFNTPEVPDVLQVAAEFKKFGVSLDAPQASRSDRRSPVEQGLGYLAAARRGMIGNEAVRPTWAIVTDMNEFRLYWYDKAPGQYLTFSVVQRDLLSGAGLLGSDEEARFDRYLFQRLFHADTLLTRSGKSELEALVGQSFVRQRELETTFYGDYRAYREHLYETLRAANASFPGTQGQLVRLAQKLLDRSIFIFYCEDMGAALGFPPQILRDFLIEKSRDPYLDPKGDTVWSQLRALFAAMNDGTAFGGRRINQFNGGLFAPDPQLEALAIPNHVFCWPGQGQNEATLYEKPKTLLYLSAAYNYAADFAKGLTTPPVAAISPEETPAKEAANARKADPDTALGLYTLGRIFEQSITELEIIEARAEGRVSVNEESKRKRDGVYYTPEWVVERIVRETLGARLQDLKSECGWPDPEDTASGDPDRAAVEAYRERLRDVTVLDPACGSGAFLITALKHLLEEWAALREIRARVTGETLKREDDALIRDVLTQNLFGVDINPASVEITQLALWLHTARGDRPLSSLGHHIRDGNSLIGSDFWKGQGKLGLVSEEEKERVNTFDWADAFPDVMAAGGFDVVIGNPPYVKLQNFRQAHPDMADFLRHGIAEIDGIDGYRSAATGNFDLFLPFIEKGLDLLKPDGRLGYIAPSVWVVNRYGEGLRELVAEGRTLDRWLDFRSHQIFEEAITYTALQFFRKPVGAKKTAAEKARAGEADAGRVLVADAPDGEVPPEPWSGGDAALPYDQLAFGDRWLMLSGAERALIDRLEAECTRLDDAENTSAIFVGLQTSADTIYHLERIAAGRYLSVASGTRAAPLEVAIEDAIMHPLVSGSEAKRYTDPATTTYILFPYAPDAAGKMGLIPAAAMQRDHPLAWRYLQSHEGTLRRREAKVDRAGDFKRNKDGTPVRAPFDDEEWFRFGRSQGLDKQDTRKLIVAQTVPAMRVCFDAKGDKYLNNVRVNGILPAKKMDPYFLLAVLNAPVADFVFRRIAKPKAGGWFEANKQFIAPLPVPKADDAARAGIADRAKSLQALHSRRRDTLADLRRRIDGSPRRSRRSDFLFPAIALPADREDDAPSGQDAAAWAKRTHEEAVDAALAAIDAALHGDVVLRAKFERGELRLLADGAPVIAGVFLSEEDGPFIEAQWNAVADAFTPGGRSTAKFLARDLRLLVVTDNAVLRTQIIELQAEVRAVDGEIERAERGMNDALAALYGLTEAERALVEA